MSKIRDLLPQLLAAPAVPLSLFDRCFPLLLKLYQAIPEAGVAREVRAALGGYLIPEGPGVVGHLARAMREDPRGFSKYPDAQGLLSDQARAHGWLALHVALQELADRALVLHQVQQAAVTRVALGILRDVETDARGPYAGVQDRERAGTVRVASLLLRAWHRRIAGRGRA